MKQYRTAEWKAFRKRVIDLAGGVCSKCKRDDLDGLVLQVHHLFYVAGRAPWEYNPEDCAVLCKGCHAAEHGIIAPFFGWDFHGWDDLGGLYGTCDCCGKSLRYLFLVGHPKWGTMEVGETCCDNLTSTQAASGHMDSRRRYISRKARP